MKRIVVLGGGISGLALAYFLAKQNRFEIHLIEKRDRPGGWIDSDNSGGFFFEKGPRIFRGSKSGPLLQLIRELGMEEEIVLSNPEAKTRYLWKGGKLRKIPMFSGEMLMGALKDLFAKPVQHDETVWDFACRRFNLAVAENIFDPMVTGIFGGSSKEISMKLAFPQMKEFELKHGSVIKGFFKAPKFQGPQMFSLQRGMRSLIKRLEEMTPVHFHYGEEVVSIQEGFTVKTTRQVYEADFLFSALPPQEMGKLFIPQLLNIPMRGTTIVNFGYQEKVLSQKGFGYLVSSSENEDVLGVMFDSNSYPQFNRSENETRLTLLLKGDDLSDEEARDVSMKALKKHLHITTAPSVSLVMRAPHVFPQMKIGHEKKIEAVEALVREKYPRLRLVGNYFYGASVSDCISKAQSVAENFLSACVS